MQRKPSDSPGLCHVAGAVADCFRNERERWPLWAPVLIGIGIAGYFTLGSEPPVWLGVLFLLVAAGFLWSGRGHNATVLFSLAFGLTAIGFSAAQLRTHLVAAPILERPITGALSGRVLQVEAFASGPRILLDNVRLRNLPADRTPERVRLRLRAADLPEVGSRISVFARLLPPGAPAAPGAYDFQRHAWFARIGAVGYAFGLSRQLKPMASDSKESWTVWIATFRQQLAERIRAAIPGASGAVAAALITGDRSAIPKEVVEAMRDSGLAHLLAISGLHMGLVAATLFFGLRTFLAMSELLALRYPIKKWAAAVALAGAFGYLLLTGATIPTQRAFLMAGLVLLAVLLDRTAISLRLVAWAAAAILLITPESLLSASFQMSFAAVVALVAVYEHGQRLVGDWAGGGWGRKIALYLSGVGLTTLVAGLATGIFALYHFGRIAHFSLAANLLAVPVTAFWIMPWGVIAMALMPFGLEAWALVPMGWGIDLVTGTARDVAGWPGAVSLVPAMPVFGLAAAAIGGLWLCLWQRRWRYAGIVGIVAGLASVSLHSPPDILVSSDGSLVGVRAGDGELLLSTTQREKRTARTWLSRSGQNGARSWHDSFDVMSCDSVACIYRAKGQVISLVKDPRALAEDCRRADIVISAVPVRWSCPTARLVVDRFDLWRHGGHAVWLDSLKVETVTEKQGRRPWVTQRRRKSSNAAGVRSTALVP
ncbi:MAG: ComEC/Rec2 family competence protein [Rhodospirillaceae bacterium]|nr:ComEC/Rec2 family competence protein [Rhodospirillaceae bacterium]